MAQLIVLQDALHTRVKLGSQPARVARVQASGPTVPLPVGQAPRKQDVDRAILLLDLAARQTRLLAKQINDPSRRENFEAQIATVEQLLQLARGMAMKL